LFTTVDSDVHRRDAPVPPSNKEQRMMSNWIQPRQLVMACALLLGLAVLSQVLSAAPTVWLVTFTIDSDQPYAVSADALGPDYWDYRLGTGEMDDPNYCVETIASGGLFIRFNRELDGEGGTQYCGLFGGSPRQYSVTISNAAACAELRSHGYPTGPDAPCVITDTDKPRIRITNDLYGKRTTRTPVAFLTKWYNVYATSYEVRTETDATVTAVGLDPSVRVVSYAGNARLWRFEAGEKPKAVADPFPLPFQMTFARTAQ
jgi:hypothetical protein